MGTYAMYATYGFFGMLLVVLVRRPRPACRQTLRGGALACLTDATPDAFCPGYAEVRGH